MNTLRHPSSVTALALAFSTTPAAAQSVAVESGGVGLDEFALLKTRAHEYSLELLLAAKHSGAYLADVDVVVQRMPDGEVVVEHRTEGPLLLADSAPGRYRLDAQFDDVVPGAPARVSRVFDVPREGLRRLVVYFDTGDRVGR